MKIPKRFIQKKNMLKEKIHSIREKKEIDEEQSDQENIEKRARKSPLKGGDLKRIKGKPPHHRSYVSGPCRYHVRGLYNYSMMCYFNIVLQNLLSLEILREHYVNTACPHDSLASTLKELYVVTGPNSSTELFEPIYMYFKFRARARQFTPYEEHDSQELLLTLLNKLAEEDFSTPTFVDSVFRVETVTTITCSVCGTVSENCENHFNLGLPILYKKRLSKWKKIIKPLKPVRKAANIMRGRLKTKRKDPGSADVSKVNEVATAKDLGDDNQSKVDGVAPVKVSGSADESKVVNATSVEGSGRDDSSRVEDVTVKKGSNSDDESKAEAMAKVKGKSIAKDSQSDDESKVGDATCVEGSRRDDLSKVEDVTVSSDGSEADAVAKVKGKSIAEDSGIDDESNVEDVMVSSDAMKAALAKVKGKSIAEDFGIDDEPKVEDVIISSDAMKAALAKVKGKSISEDSGIDDKSEVKDAIVSSDALEPALAKVKGKSIVEDSGIDDESQVDDAIVLYDELQAALAKIKGKSIVEDSGDDYESEVEKFNVDSSYLFKTRSYLPGPRPPKKDTSENYRVDDEPKGKTKSNLFTKWALPQSLSPKKVFVRGCRSGADIYGPDAEDLEVDNTNGPVSVDSLLTKLLRTKAAPQDWCCGNCKAANGSSKVDIRLAPRILILHLLRFHQDPTPGLIRKIHGHVVFNEIINFGQFGLGQCMPSSSSQTGEVRYRLMGVIEHKGTSGGGHYEAFVRGGCPGDEWFRADDEDLIPATLKDVLHREAYLLFYQRI